MRSAAAKSRRRLAACRSSMSRSISSTGTGGWSSSAFRSDRMPSTWSNVSNAPRMTGTSSVPTCPAVDRGVQRSDQFEHRSEGGSGIQVVPHRIAECRARLGDTRGDFRMRSRCRDRINPGEAVGEPAQRLLRLQQALPREIELLAIVRREQQVADGGRPVSARDDVGNRVRVAQRLRHLLLVDDEVLDVHPEPRERFAGRALALGDLVLVMREDEIDAAGVNVDRRRVRGSGAPWRSTRGASPGRPGGSTDIPRRFARLGRLPQHEIARIVFRVGVGVDAGARLHALVIEVGQLAVVGHRGDLEVDRAVAAVGVPVLFELRRSASAIACDVGRVGGARDSPRPASRPSARASSRNAAMYWSV